MAQKGHSGPLWPLWPTVRRPWSMGPLGLFWPKSNDAKWAHLGPFWPQNPTNPGMAKKTLGPQNLPRITSGHNSAHGLWKPPEAIRSSPSKDSPQVEGKISSSSMHPALKAPGVMHTWYNIPSCTIFAQQSNGDIFRTK
ncbi:hypothetical protein O181_055276 [Austropuccinia psidii MF-1]|uniref:Uncharacterized protein n=1 Tax=Austropuccinia psidii MF-1 TaxID=1389203 RepID=A0A9Q3HRW9_9BASI|nr:hypothetical protein [Austropuccinia psidii MF-1]